jgi:hypothetical protein
MQAHLSLRSLSSTALLLGVLCTSGSALAGPRHHHDDDDYVPSRAVPEISAKYAGAAFVLVVGGVAVVLGRRRRAA